MLLPVDDVLAQFQPVWGPTWDDVFHFFRQDPHERALVLALVEELRAAGEFREPIHLDRGGDGAGFVADGTHRLVAHVEAGFTHVKVTTLPLPDLGAFEVKWGTQPAGAHKAVGRNRSFRLDAQHWVTIDSWGASMRVPFAIAYGVSQELGEVLRLALEQRMPTLGAVQEITWLPPGQ